MQRRSESRRVQSTSLDRLTVSFRILNSPSEKHSVCVRECAQTAVPKEVVSRRHQSTRVVASNTSTRRARPSCAARQHRFIGLLLLAKVRQQRRPFLRRHKSTIHHKAIRRENRRQVRRRIQARHASEERIVMVEDFLEGRGGVVVEIRSGPADSTQLGDVHDAEIRRLTGEQQSPRIRRRDGLKPAVREGDLVRPRVTRQSRRTGREAVGPGRGHALAMLWYRTTGRTSAASGVDVLGCDGPPWHWAQARVNTALPCCSISFNSGSGSGKADPERIALARTSTPGDENNVCWNAARSSNRRV